MALFPSADSLTVPEFLAYSQTVSSPQTPKLEIREPGLPTNVRRRNPETRNTKPATQNKRIESTISHYPERQITLRLEPLDPKL
jgi:hypothetical protein